MSAQQLSSVQALRALAACAVAVAHTQVESATIAALSGRPSPLPSLVLGAAGVDLFFVISGFVMVYASWSLFQRPGAVGTFVARRLVRIVPLYWFGTTYFLLIGLWVSGWSLAAQDWTHVAASYFFIPMYREASAWNPLMPIGWTLNQEMFFYLLFALVLPLPRRLAIAGLCLLLLGLALYSPQIPHLPDAIRYLSNSYLLEFAAGAAIGWAYREGLRLPRWLAFGLGGIGAAAIVACGTFDVTPQMVARQVAYGVPSVLLVIAALHFAEPPGRAGALRRLLVLLGDASYSIYIMHGIVMMVIRLTFQMTDPAPLLWLWNWPWLYMILLAAVAIGASVVFHLAVERPVTARLRAAVTRPNAARIAAAT